MSTKTIINLRKVGNRIEKIVQVLDLTPEEQAVFDQKVADHAARRQAYQDAIAGLTQEEVRRYNIRQRLIEGYQSKDPQVMEVLRTYLEKARRVLNNENLKFSTLTAQQRNQILDYIVDDIYDERFG